MNLIDMLNIYIINYLAQDILCNVRVVFWKIQSFLNSQLFKLINQKLVPIEIIFFIKTCAWLTIYGQSPLLCTI